MSEKRPICVCGKPLFKRMDTGPVSRRDLYAWCRNTKCGKFNIPQFKTRFHPIASVKLEPIKEEETKKDQEKIEEKPKPKENLDEPDVVKQTRLTVRNALKDFEKSHGKSIIGLAFAIAAQETGSFAVANRLISEYGLEKLYGIKKSPK